MLLPTQTGATQCPGNILALQAQLRPRVFQGCTALRHLNLGLSGCSPACPNRCLPDCCFLEAGIVALFLPPVFNRIGSAACVSCQQLQTVDLSQTDVIEILGSTFAHCSQLQQLSLPRNLRIIEQEAFLKRISLQEVCTPPSLLYIARRALIPPSTCLCPGLRLFGTPRMRRGAFILWINSMWWQSTVFLNISSFAGVLEEAGRLLRQSPASSDEVASPSLSSIGESASS